MKITLSVPASPLKGTVTLSASVIPSGQANSVQFFIDGALVATDTTVPYSYSWNTTAVADGQHSLEFGFYADTQYSNEIQHAAIALA